ncbi:uncharacterized protein E0L32_005607 [Thyridium curvatum]|uniref:Uncharacterized protein n=1 Tax=Thyridium curvatum TaxID=1093900 RepID=A0A507B2F1_9PEZI|nr:uncharacterized protein E0L32_005607 [Thyridium curvatum]TPX13907.1 hypothetical protein E0L32_005607 [Thyridium curvatum]
MKVKVTDKRVLRVARLDAADTRTCMPTGRVRASNKAPMLARFLASHDPPPANEALARPAPPGFAGRVKEEWEGLVVVDPLAKELEDMMRKAKL